MPNSSIKMLNLFLLSLTIVSTILTIGCYIFNSNKGYNFLDEGFYLLNGANPIDTKLQLTSFNQYLHLLMLVNSNIIFLRLSTLFISLASVGFLAYSFKRLLPQYNNNKLHFSVLMACSMATVYGLSFMYPTEPNYNSLTIVGVVIFYSLSVLFLTAKGRKYYNFYSFLLGFTATFVFFNKFPAGILLIVLSFFTIGLVGIKDNKLAKQSFVFLVLGILFHLVLFFIFMQNWHTFFTTYKAGFQSTKIMQANHSIDLLSQYCKQFKELMAFSYNRYKFIFYFAFLLCILRQIKTFAGLINSRTIPGYGLLLSFFMLSFNIDKNWGSVRFMGLASFYLSTIFILLLIRLSNSLFSEIALPKKNRWITLWLIILLFLLPLIVSVGTNNPIYMQILLSCFVWVPIIVYLAYSNSKIMGNSFMYLTVAGVSILSAHYAIYTIYELPYGLYGNLSTQQYLTKVRDTQLYVDSTTKYIIDSTREQLKSCGFKPNDYVVSLTDMPGLTYAVEARSPACAWYFGGYPGSEKLAQFCLNLTSETNPTYILLNSYDGQQRGFSENSLNNYFPHFSQQYILCGEIKDIPVEGGVCCKVPFNNIKIFKPLKNA